MLWIQERPAIVVDSPASRPGALEARLRAEVERLAIPRHRWANSDGNRWVREELAGALERHGFEVTLQGRFQNVVALPRRPRGPITVIAAHYDTVPDCPGADDNASGLAVMLECAAALTDGGVGFIAFNAEEEGLLGSSDFVMHGLPSLHCPIAQAHILEMVGFRGASASSQALPLPWLPRRLRAPDFIGLLAKAGSNMMAEAALRSSEAPALRVLSAKTWGPLHRLIPDITRSDHFPFWCAGVPALLWTDTGNFRNPHYHRRSDGPDTLDYGFMAEVAVLLTSVARRAGARRHSAR